jgi:hypothetical protein
MTTSSAAAIQKHFHSINPLATIIGDQWADSFEHDLVGKPASTFPDRAPRFWERP